MARECRSASDSARASADDIGKTMKRALFVLLLVATPLFAFDAKHRTVVEDVIRMSQAGVADEAIIAFVVHTREPFEVSADDVIAMTNAHVSKDVIKAVVDEAEARKNARRRDDDDDIPFYYQYYDPWWFMPRYYKAGVHTRIATWSPPAASSKSSVRSQKR